MAYVFPMTNKCFPSKSHDLQSRRAASDEAQHQYWNSVDNSRKKRGGKYGIRLGPGYRVINLID